MSALFDRAEAQIGIITLAIGAAIYAAPPALAGLVNWIAAS